MRSKIIIQGRMDLVIKEAEEKDIPVVLSFIKKLAEYEKLTTSVTADEDTLKDSLFGRNSDVKCLLAYHQNKPVAFAVYFFNFSTFVGRRGLYLEDLFVLPEMRGKGFGKQILKHLAKVAMGKNCKRFEWSVLDWNKPAIKFYEKLGAKQMSDWRIFRLNENEILKLADEN